MNVLERLSYKTVSLWSWLAQKTQGSYEMCNVEVRVEVFLAKLLFVTGESVFQQCSLLVRPLSL